MLVNPELYEEGNECQLDHSHNQYQTLSEDGFSQTILPNCNPTFSIEEQLQISYSQQHAAAAAAAAVTIEMEFQQQMGMEINENCYNPNNIIDTHFVQIPNHQQSNWETHHQEMNYNDYPQIQEIQQNDGNFINSSSCPLPETPYSQTPDLLNLFHLPRCSSSMFPNSSISITNPTHKLGFLGHDLPPSDSVSASCVLYDPMFHLNLPPPPSFRELFQSNFPRGCNLPEMKTDSLFDGAEEREGSGEFNNGVLEFSREINCLMKRRGGKEAKQFDTEKQRRVHLNDKYQALKQLVPISTKPDRASIVGDAINYIKELQRTLDELKVLVEKKRYSRERFRRQKTEDESVLEVESTNMKPHVDPELQMYDGSSLRSSWLQRKSKNTQVDVRIIDDEVTIKLVQQKRINCLLFVSKVLDELHLDLHYVAGGLIGDFYSFLFNTKTYEGSSVYASAVANRLIDLVDRQYAASQQTSSY